MLNINDYKHIHCIGIGGIGLSAVAEICKSRGFEVSGSDMKTSEMTDHLTEQGRTCLYRARSRKHKRCRPRRILCRCLHPENPEIVAAKENGIHAR